MAATKIQLLYFASLKEQLGVGEESLSLETVTSVADLVALLAARGGSWQTAFSGQQPLLAAVNQLLCGPETVLQSGDEVAFFPPVSGG
ncbi:MAG: molybdopterin converting factor subunit 1 [Gammaproteobacteria bacterium]|nr:molybdopterin converting factor subunit 1 [Gammaproteobacteria bacterium]